MKPAMLTLMVTQARATDLTLPMGPVVQYDALQAQRRTTLSSCGLWHIARLRRLSRKGDKPSR